MFCCTFFRFRSRQLDSLGRASIWYIQFPRYILGENFLVFSRFSARNGLEFLVSREKSKCEKNPTYKCNNTRVLIGKIELMNILKS